MIKETFRKDLQAITVGLINGSFSCREIECFENMRLYDCIPREQTLLKAVHRSHILDLFLSYYH